MGDALCCQKVVFFQKLSLSCFRFPIQLGFGDQPWFSISVPRCLCLFWVLELCKRKAETPACEGKFLELLAQGPNVFSPEFGGYFEEGFELDGDAREDLKA